MSRMSSCEYENPNFVNDSGQSKNISYHTINIKQYVTFRMQ